VRSGTLQRPLAKEGERLRLFDRDTAQRASLLRGGLRSADSEEDEWRHLRTARSTRKVFSRTARCMHRLSTPRASSLRIRGLLAEKLPL